MNKKNKVEKRFALSHTQTHSPLSSCGDKDNEKGNFVFETYCEYLNISEYLNLKIKMLHCFLL